MLPVSGNVQIVFVSTRFGSFPSHPVPHVSLRRCANSICCAGFARKLMRTSRARAEMDMKGAICYHMGPMGRAVERPRPYGVPSYDRLDPDVPPSDAMWSLDTLLRILVEPAGFFRDRRSDCAFSHVASFCMIHAVVLTVVGFAAATIGEAAAGNITGTTAESLRTVSILAICAAAAAMAALIVSVALAGLLHPIVMLVGGRGGYRATYAAVVYGAAPAGLTFVLGLYLAQLMPNSGGPGFAVWLNVAGMLWSVALFAMGVTELNGMNALSGSIVTLVPMAAIAALAAWLAGPEAPPRGLRALTIDISGITWHNPFQGGLPSLRDKPWIVSSTKARKRHSRSSVAARRPKGSLQRARNAPVRR